MTTLPSKTSAIKYVFAIGSNTFSWEELAEYLGCHVHHMRYQVRLANAERRKHFIYNDHVIQIHTIKRYPDAVHKVRKLRIVNGHLERKTYFIPYDFKGIPLVLEYSELSNTIINTYSEAAYLRMKASQMREETAPAVSF